MMGYDKVNFVLKTPESEDDLLDEETNYNQESPEKVATKVNEPDIKDIINQSIKDNLKHYHNHFKFQNFMIVMVLISSLLINIFLITDRKIIPENKETEVQGAISKVIPDKNAYIINNFLDSNTIMDAGSKINIKQAEISHEDSKNCQTPIVPPIVNGCGFSLVLQGAQSPTNTTIKSLKLEGVLPENSKIQLDLKSYQTEQIKSNIAIIQSKDIGNEIILPLHMEPTDTIYFRFWSLGGTIKIQNIIVNYDQEVSGN